MCFIVLVADIKQRIKGVCWSPGDSMELPVGPLGGSPHPGDSGNTLQLLQGNGKVCAESVNFTKVLRGWRMKCEVPLCV